MPGTLMLPAWVRATYPLARTAGIWPWLRSVRLAWLRWLAHQMPITDMRQQEILLERFALERLP